MIDAGYRATRFSTPAGGATPDPTVPSGGLLAASAPGDHRDQGGKQFGKSTTT
jgi:hypothetical protein